MLNRGKIGFNTIIIGSNGKALKIYKEIMSVPDSSGNLFKGFVNYKNEINSDLIAFMPHLGNFEEVGKIIIKQKIEEVIIAVETDEQIEIEKIISELIKYNILIKIIPGLYEVLSGPVRITHFTGVPLLTVSNYLLQPWEAVVKRSIDIISALAAFTFGLPFFIFASAGVKISSKGPIFYRQERIGLKGKPFSIVKFRSMATDAEKNGPQLSSENDNRTTKFGKFLRKTRLDEIPQFYNVLKGEMSLVGPRPERQFYIDKITEKAPYFLRLLKVKPGITSWGQVKFGYAETVEQMIQRLYYDINYVENMSLYFDFKILINTVLIILKREGK